MATTDTNGKILNEWAERENLSLIFDAKDLGTFRSGRWQKDYNVSNREMRTAKHHKSEE